MQVDEPAGDVLIGGQVVTHLAPRIRNIAMVFQSYALYPHMTVFENVAYGLRVRNQCAPAPALQLRLDAFAGGFTGWIARTDDLSENNIKRAVIYGSTLASWPSRRSSITSRSPAAPKTFWSII